MNPVIEFNSLSKRFGQIAALDELSLQVPEGSVFALLGENGAGKSTAIRILLGLERATRGTASVLGLDSVRQGLQIRRVVGYVPDRPMHYDWMTIRELGWFTGGFYDNHQSVIDNYLRFVEQFGLDPNQKIGTLSKGMNAKVALTLALAHDPKILILDEPTSGLDTMVRRDFLDSMVELAAAGRTVFISSHQIGEVERIADYVAVISRGRVMTVDRLDEIKAESRHLLVTCESALVDAPPFNGELISKEQRGRQWSLMLRGAGPDVAGSVRERPGVVAVEESAPSLEDIYLAYLRRATTSLADR
jgi:ABC-2 type transport system ATP-binding protein